MPGVLQAMARRPQPLLLDPELLDAAREVAAWGAARAAAGESGPGTGEVLTLIALLHSMPRLGRVDHLLAAPQALLLDELCEALLDEPAGALEPGDELLVAAGQLTAARQAAALSG